MHTNFTLEDPELGAAWLQVSRQPHEETIRLVISFHRSWDVDLALSRDAARQLSTGLIGGKVQMVTALDEDQQPATVTAGAGWLAVTVPDDNLDGRVQLGTETENVSSALLSAATQ